MHYTEKLFFVLCIFSIVPWTVHTSSYNARDVAGLSLSCHTKTNPGVLLRCQTGLTHKGISNGRLLILPHIFVELAIRYEYNLL